MNDLEIVGEIGSVEWWGSVRDTRGKIEHKIEELERSDGCDDRELRGWYDMLIRLDKMVGDANGIFIKESKAIDARGGNTFVVVMPNRDSIERKVEVIESEVIDG